MVVCREGKPGGTCTLEGVCLCVRVPVCVGQNHATTIRDGMRSVGQLEKRNCLVSVPLKALTRPQTYVHTHTHTQRESAVK